MGHDLHEYEAICTDGNKSSIVYVKIKTFDYQKGTKMLYLEEQVE